MLIADDSLNYHSGRQFSTKDVDNDKATGYNCTKKNGGGGSTVVFIRVLMADIITIIKFQTHTWK